MSKETKPETAEEALVEVEQTEPTANVVISSSTTSPDTTYFFPEGPFSCTSDSIEEATKRFEQHMKGNA